jgi:hypothetical protein
MNYDGYFQRAVARLRDERYCHRDGAIIFADLIGKFDLLHGRCPSCSSNNCYRRTINSVCLPQSSHSKVRSSAFSSGWGQR